MATIVTRAGKGSPLTNTEVDANFTNLNTELGTKANTSSLATVATTGVYSDLTGKPTNVSSFTNDSSYITSSALTGYLTSSTAASTYQPLDGDLTAIAGLAGTTGIVRKTAANTYTLDTATYLTGITSGQVTTALGFTPYNATNPSGYITSADLTGYITSSTAASTYQPLDGDLTAIAALAGATGFVKKTAANTYTLDTATYLTSITSTNVTTALGFTPYNATNPSGYITSSGSISGSAASLSNNTSYMVSRGTFAAANIDTAVSNGFYQQTNASDSSAVLVFNAGGSVGPFQQRFTYAGNFEFRNQTDSTNWNAWKTVWHSANFDPSTKSNTGHTHVIGDVTGLQTALDGKQASLGFTPYNATNPAGYITGISSANVTTALGFTPYNSTNPSGYITSSALSGYLTSSTAASTYQPLDGDLTAIAALAGTTGLIRKTAADTYSLDTASYLTGITSGQVTTALGFTPYNATNPSGYITGISSANVTTALGFTPYNATNPAGYITSSGSSASCTGNAATATNLSTGRTNWNTNGTISAVVGQLAWKNYGNNHTIFDASAGTAPDGTAINNTNAGVAWAGTYPTLMGWNGASTYGVRVDSARVADNATTAGFATKASTLSQSGGDNVAMTFYWSGQGGQPTWLWGSNNGTDIYVYNPSNFSVNYASTAGTANDPNKLPLTGGTVGRVTARVGGISLGTGNSAQLEINNAGSGAANISFHREGAYGAHFGLDTDNVFSTYGWSAGSGYTGMRTGFLTAYGTITATDNITAYSDIRVKANVETISNALDKLDQIRGVTYTRTDLEDKERRYAGVIAQEVEAVLPEAVFENEEHKSVDYNATIGLLIQAVKELRDEVEMLRK